MNLRCAIIDDEPLALGLLESYVRKTPSLELCGRYSSAIQAMQALSEQPVDLLFLDIRKHSVNHVFLSPTSIINFTSKKQSYDDTRRSSRDNELLQRAQSDL